jgi:DNA polymerase-1
MRVSSRQLSIDQGRGGFADNIERALNDRNAPNIKELMDKSPEIAIDTETDRITTRKEFFKLKMRGLSVSPNGEDAAYFTDPTEWATHTDLKDKTWIFHNAKFDIPVLERHGLTNFFNFEDTLIAAHLLDENREKKLKTLARYELGIDDPLLFDQADEAGDDIDREIFHSYARNDARYTYQLWKKYKGQLVAQDLLRVYEIEKGIVPVLIDIERKGIRVDLSLLGELKDEVDKSRREVLKKIHEASEGRAVTQYTIFDDEDSILKQVEGCIRSNAKMAELFYDRLELPAMVLTKKGARSVSKDALAELEDLHPVILHIQEFRGLDKLKSAFLEPLPEFVHEDGRIHPDFNSLGTVTGRMSNRNPNVQQIPSRTELGKKLRRAFAAAPGHSLVVADYSAMEMRILAGYMLKSIGDDSLAKIVLADDPHTITAERMKEKSGREIPRVLAKMLNFGSAYGVTAKGLSTRLTAQGIPISESDADDLITTYFETYPGMKQMFGMIHNLVYSRGYVKNAYGRRRRFDYVNDRALRQAVNFVIQSTAADIVKDAMVRLYMEFKLHLPEAELLGQIHDEILVEVRDEDGEKCKEIMEEVMAMNTHGLPVDMVADAKIAKNWGDAK